MFQYKKLLKRRRPHCPWGTHGHIWTSSSVRVGEVAANLMTVVSERRIALPSKTDKLPSTSQYKNFKQTDAKSTRSPSNCHWGIRHIFALDDVYLHWSQMMFCSQVYSNAAVLSFGGAMISVQQQLMNFKPTSGIYRENTLFFENSRLGSDLEAFSRSQPSVALQH